jgi:hypothetical protein
MSRPAASSVISSILVFAMLQTFPDEVFCQEAPAGPQNPPSSLPVPAQPVAGTTQPEGPKTNPSSKFVLQDGTPIKLRISRNVSSENATVGESVDFEVLEEVMIDGIVVVPKGGLAIGTVTEAVPKRRMGRAGKLEIVLDYVRLADKDKAAVRAVKDAKGGSHTAGMTVGIVATGLLFWPAAPLFLLMHGKDITVPKGAEITAYVNGDQRLVATNFNQEGETFVPMSAAPGNTAMPADGQNSASAQTATPPVAQAIVLATYELQSDPSSAEVYVDGSYVGNTPATLKLKSGQHTIRVALNGYKEWTRELTVQEGSEAHLNAGLEKLE